MRRRKQTKEGAQVFEGDDRRQNESQSARDYLPDKAYRVSAVLSHMIPSVGGPKQSKLQVIATAVTYTMLYAAPAPCLPAKDRKNIV